MAAHKGKHTKTGNDQASPALSGSIPQTQNNRNSYQASSSSQSPSTTSSMPQAALADPANTSTMTAFSLGYKKAGKHRGLKVAGIACGIVAACLMVVYGVGVSFFGGHLYPNTTISGYDVSMKTPDDVGLMLNNTMEDYAFTISGQGLEMTLRAKESGVGLNGEEIAQGMMESINPWEWPYQVFQPHDETARLQTKVDTEQLLAKITEGVDEFNQESIAPINATISYNAADQEFSIKSEVYGTALDAGRVTQQVSDALVDNMPSRIHITEDALMIPAVVSTDPQLIDAQSQANAMAKANPEVWMGDSLLCNLEPNTVGPWIGVNDDLTFTLDENGIHDWANNIKGTYDSIGSERTYTRPDGKVVTISGGDYGWNIDSEGLFTAVRDSVLAANTEPLSVPTFSKARAIGGNGQKDWGNRYVDVDLSSQYARFYDDNGNIIWESGIISGMPTSERATPTGVWDLNDKGRNVKLIGYKPNGEKDYETPVAWWMPFKGNSVGFHDADWQPSSGFGTDYYTYGGSHGCVNLPPSKAQELYGVIQVGDVVVTHW